MSHCSQTLRRLTTRMSNKWISPQENARQHRGGAHRLAEAHTCRSKRLQGPGVLGDDMPKQDHRHITFSQRTGCVQPTGSARHFTAPSKCSPSFTPILEAKVRVAVTDALPVSPITQLQIARSTYRRRSTSESSVSPRLSFRSVPPRVFTNKNVRASQGTPTSRHPIHHGRRKK